jgi:hypothetical protein
LGTTCGAATTAHATTPEPTVNPECQFTVKRLRNRPVILLPDKPDPRGIYCDGAVEKRGRGEHIVPKTIGGAVYLSDVSDKRVCTKCNNGVLSDVDRELCSRSFLSGVASQEIDAHLWQVWDIDHSSNNLLIDALAQWNADHSPKGLICFPQITFEKHGPDFRVDSEEGQKFGLDNFEAVL